MSWKSSHTLLFNILAKQSLGYLQCQQSDPPNALVPAHVVPNGDSEVPVSMGQHRKMPMSGDFVPWRNSNEKQEGFLQLHSPHLLHGHSKAVHSGIGSASVLTKVRLIQLFAVLVVSLDTLHTAH